MKAVRPLPREFEKLLGEEGAEKFTVFLNDAFEDQKGDVIKAVSDSFHKHVTDEVSKVRLEVADLKVEVKADLAELRTDMADLRTELKTEMAELRAELKANMTDLQVRQKADTSRLENKIAELRADMKTDIADVHKSISAQTRWILAALLGGALLYPVAIKLIDRLFP